MNSLRVACRACRRSGARAAACSSPPCAAAPAGRARRRRRTARARRWSAAAPRARSRSARLGVLALGDVVEHRDRVERPAVGVAHQRDRDVAPRPARAVLAQVALLEARRLDLAGAERARAARRSTSRSSGARCPSARAAEQLRFADSRGSRTCARLTRSEAPVEAHVREPESASSKVWRKRSSLSRSASSACAARGDVVEDRDLVERLAVGVALDHHAERHPDHRAVLAQVALLEAHRVDLAGVQRSGAAR